MNTDEDYSHVVIRENAGGTRRRQNFKTYEAARHSAESLDADFSTLIAVMTKEKYLGYIESKYADPQDYLDTLNG